MVRSPRTPRRASKATSRRQRCVCLAGAALAVLESKAELELAAQYLTEADLAAQAAIVTALPSTMKGLLRIRMDVSPSHPLNLLNG